MAKAPPTIDLYIAARNPEVRDLLEDLRRFLHEVLPKAEAGMKWGAPVWSVRGTPIAYIYGGRDHANLGFIRGAGLSDPEGLLEGAGKQGRHVKLWPGKPIPEKALKALLREAARNA